MTYVEDTPQVDLQSPCVEVQRSTTLQRLKSREEQNQYAYNFKDSLKLVNFFYFGLSV